MRAMAGLVAMLTLAGGADAAVVDARTNGFEVRETVEIAAAAPLVWAALSDVGAWWDSKHTFSGDPANLSIVLKPGGCFCEDLPAGGGVEHMRVIYVRPKTAVRLAGALGPLEGVGASGHMEWALKTATNGKRTIVTLTYDVGGYAKDGLDKWAGPVDGVLGEQLGRLKTFVETGKPQ